ncbi:Exodeoxyribonuclease VII large subunit [Methylophaga frappieri]|uniref:Exodeoxyribonuclease 7 large subunit n=1 Tax=Methylophaga frappieri (strain ATCC BAA-2434 / DSM 25690 / JAM7) TaxID=754477 RepID=I1YIB5_METFJ|nr:exodeoxyribonuclease VII large subunit [Methylophaga frappieri]AFJ02658.1 Exodeoxyribonuclease VII large subunit [Methylophaga frappieri]
MAAPVTSDSSSKLAKRQVTDIYGVSRLVRETRQLLDGSFPLLWVEGEISNLAMPGSGHLYFTLKDEAAQVRCAMFRGRNQYLRLTPENGMQVLLRVRVTLYEGRGEFQLIVEHMESAGSGALQRAYEALKARLGLAGLFDTAHKKTLPSAPTVIGIVSSPDGAAVHDILSVLKRRFPAVNVIIYPTAVQGETAPSQIKAAIELAASRKECEVLIVGRGGGSLEDLWAFNDEKVAQAIFACQIPVISAVGHEVDFTIADFVADVRAPTPSAAAEMAVPDMTDLLRSLAQTQNRLSLTIKRRLQQQNHYLHYLRQRLPHPRHALRSQQELLQRLCYQLQSTMQRRLQSAYQRTDFLQARILHPQAKIAFQRQKLLGLEKQLNAHWQHHIQSVSQRLQRSQQQVGALQGRLHKTLHQQLQSRRQSLTQQARTLSAVSPLNTLDRGYSITSCDDGRVVTNSAQVTTGDAVSIRLHQGVLQCKVMGKR